jgi:hypothetical protein
MYRSITSDLIVEWLKVQREFSFAEADKGRTEVKRGVRRLVEQ